MLTQNEIAEILRYEPSTGKCYYTEEHIATRNNLKLDKPIGSLSHRQLVVAINGKTYLLHRLIDMLLNGYKHEIVTHRDGDKTNNKLDNLLFLSRKEAKNVARVVNNEPPKKRKKVSKPLTQKALKEQLSYDSSTGVFTRKKAVSGYVVGDICGSTCKTGYVQISVKHKLYKAHRLAWLYTYGYFPEEFIDHINHNRADNRIGNLREVSVQENNKNRAIPKQNTSGVIGVSYRERCPKRPWVVQVNIEGKNVCTSFATKEEAVASRKAFEISAGYHKEHGANIDTYDNRSAEELQATPKWLDADDKELIKWVYETAKERTLQYDIPFEVDHIIPINGKDVCGFHIAENLQVITRSENRSKGYKLKGDR